TRMRATAWINDHVPAGSRIWLEDQTVILAPDRYRIAGGKAIYKKPIEWYAEQGFSFLVANVSRTPDEQVPALRSLIARAGIAIGGTSMSLGEEFAIIDVAHLGTAVSTPTPVGAAFGTAVLLVSYQHPAEVVAGKTLPLALYWQCLAQLDKDY